MNVSSEPTLRKFNPGFFQSDDEVIGQFTVRRRELGIVLEVLRGNVGAQACQHVLVVAPRGRGKTMLLARIAAELHTNQEFSERLLPVRFMEESQEIFNMSDFWLETLFHLAREIRKSDPESAEELRDTHADLAARWHGKDLEERARAAALEAADRLGKQIVLMVENLQILCGDVDDDFGWKLRKTLQSEPQIILLATATSRFKGLDDAREPFFELFRIIRLDPLDTEECRCLWQAVSGDTVSGREIRPLEILTGGNPRLLVIVAGFAQHRSLRQLMENLVSLIDDHTEYFRSHLEGFAKTERRVYLSVIDLWQPSSTGEIAARARMDVRPVSTLLGRLVNRGAVVVEGSGKKRRYVAVERLYSIYYKLRRERDEAAVVRNLVHFMTVFYSGAEIETCDEIVERCGDSDAPELQEKAAKALSNKGNVQLDLHHMEEALGTSEELERKYSALTDDDAITFEWRAMWIKMKVLLAQGKYLDSMETFRSIYSAFVPGNRIMMHQVLDHVLALIAAGALERDLIDILSNERKKFDALESLVVALRQRIGEAVRAPIEVLEIAQDIRQRIEEMEGIGGTTISGRIR